MRLVYGLPVMLSLSCLAGCTSPILDLRDDLELYRSSFRERLAADQKLTRQFLACTTQLAPPPAVEALHPERRPSDPVRSLIERIRERQPQQAESLLPLQSLVNDLAGSPRRRIALSTLQTVVDAARRWHAHLDFDEDILVKDSSLFTRLLLAYNKAYFGDLRFTREPTDTVPSRHGVMTATSTGFVDRNGNAWRFPGISTDPFPTDLTVRPFSASVSSQRVAADLTRIFLEAFFDAAFQVPAVHGATALRIEWSSPDESYPEFDADRPPIPFGSLARLTRDALRAEAAVTATVGKAVRGGGAFGTHNETLAAALETAAGVVAKKLVEHDSFCYFRVTQDNR